MTWKEPFSVSLRPGERISGLLWLALYLFVLDLLLQLGMELAGIPVTMLNLNRVYYITCFLATAIVFRHFLPDSLNVALSRPGRLLKGILLGYCIYIACQGTLSVVYEMVCPDLTSPNDSTLRSMAQSSFATVTVAAVLLAPLTEETLFRGLIFGELRKKSRPLAYVVTALCFGAIHVMGYLSQLSPVTLLLNITLYMLPSVALCFCYEYSGTIWGPIGLHALLNGLSMWAMWSEL